MAVSPSTRRLPGRYAAGSSETRVGGSGSRYLGSVSGPGSATHVRFTGNGWIDRAAAAFPFLRQ